MADDLLVELAFLPGDGVDHGPAMLRLRRHGHAREGGRAIACQTARHRATADHDAHVGATDILRQLPRQDMVDIIVGAVGDGAGEDALVLPIAHLPQRLDHADDRAGFEGGAVGRGNLHRPFGGGRRRDRTAKPFERQLPVKLIGINARLAEIIVGGGRVACLQRGAPRPIIALRLGLRRFGGLGIAAEHRHRVGRTIEIIESRRARQPGKAGIIVAHAQRLVAHIDAGRHRVVDLAGDAIGKAPLAVIGGGARLTQQHLVEFLGVGRTVGEGRAVRQILARRHPIAGVAQPGGLVGDEARIAGPDRLGHLHQHGRVAALAAKGDARLIDRAAGRADIGQYPLRAADIIAPQQFVGPQIMVSRGQARAEQRQQPRFVGGAQRSTDPGIARRDARFVHPPDLHQGGRIAGMADRRACREAREEGRHLARIIAVGIDPGFSQAPHPVLARPAGVGGDETGIGGKAQAIALLQRAPLVDRRGDGAIARLADATGDLAPGAGTAVGLGQRLHHGTRRKGRWRGRLSLGLGAGAGGEQQKGNKGHANQGTFDRRGRRHAGHNRNCILIRP